MTEFRPPGCVAPPGKKLGNGYCVPELNPEIEPNPLDKALHRAVARAVARVALEQGLNRDDLTGYFD